MTSQMYKCPVCAYQGATKQDILTHFYLALQGLGQDASEHVKWAKEQGISEVDTLFGGSRDLDGIPSGNLKRLKDTLYGYLDN
jgi:hypothetical protein